MKDKIYDESLTDRARGRWLEIVTALAPHPDLLAAIRRGPSRHGWCPVHRGKHGDAFRIDSRFSETGLVHCNTCGGRSGFGLLMWVNGWDVDTTARELGQYLDGRHASPRQPAPRTRLATPRLELDEKEDKAPSVEKLEEIWSQAFEPDHPEARPLRMYLARRGLATLETPSSLRLHPSLGYYETQPGEKGEAGTNNPYRLVGRFPTMLARVDCLGTLTGLHHTYLTPEGEKAPVLSAKKLRRARGHTTSGSVVQLTPAATILGIAEGIETSLSVLLATGMPMWAATSAPLLGAAQIPAHVRHLVIWADFDQLTVTSQGVVLDPGREAAEKLKRRLADHPLVDIYFPSSRTRGVDWNDVWRQHGQLGFPTLTARTVRLPNVRQLLTRLLG